MHTLSINVTAVSITLETGITFSADLILDATLTSSLSGAQISITDDNQFKFTNAALARGSADAARTAMCQVALAGFDPITDGEPVLFMFYGMTVAEPFLFGAHALK
jgi:hypothetical protein